MAYPGRVPWYNTYSKNLEWVEGVWCNCSGCKYDLFEDGHELTVRDQLGESVSAIPYTKAGYREHKRDRALAYWEYKRSKQATVKANMAQPKETGSRGGEGGSSLSLVPTFFDLDIGELILPSDSRAYSYRMRRIESI